MTYTVYSQPTWPTGTVSAWPPNLTVSRSVPLPSPLQTRGTITPWVSPIAPVPPAQTLTKTHLTPIQTGLPSQPLAVVPIKAHEAHHHPAPGLSSRDRLNKVVWGLGLMLAGLALHKLPPVKHASFQFFSTDPKDYIRATLGVAAVGKFNAAADLKLPPWLLGLKPSRRLLFCQMATKRNYGGTSPYSPCLCRCWSRAPMGLSRRPIRHWTNSKVPYQGGYPSSGSLDAHHHCRRFRTSGHYEYPTIRELCGQNLWCRCRGGITGAEAVVCARCSGNHLICVTEVTDMVGSLAAWFRQKMGASAPLPKI
jgi:hypothetical protein